MTLPSSDMEEFIKLNLENMNNFQHLSIGVWAAFGVAVSSETDRSYCSVVQGLASRESSKQLGAWRAPKHM